MQNIFPKRKSTLVKILIAGIWVCTFVYILFFPEFSHFLVSISQHSMLLAMTCVIILQLALATFALPCSAVPIITGAIWGIWFGTSVSIIASIIAASWTFAIGRKAKKRIRPPRYLKSKVEYAFKLIDRYGWKSVFLVYINPFMPGSTMGYIFGTSKIQFQQFFIAMFFGTMPLNIGLAISGSIMADLKTNLEQINLYLS